MKYRKLLTILSIMVSLTVAPAFANDVTEAKLYYNKGIDFYKIGQYDKSMEAFRKAIDLDPEYIDAYYNLGNTYAEMKNFSKALHYYSRSLDFNSQDTEVYNAIALLYHDFDLDNINLRDKLKVECPEFMRQCGLSQIDFGTVFLNPDQEAFIAQAQNITNDVINSVNGLHQYLTPEALQSAVDVVQFIITDLIREITGFCLKVFNEYVSVDFVAGLAKDTITSSLYYTKEYTNDPAELLEQLIKDNTEALESDAEDEKVKKRTELMNTINEKFTDTQVWIQERMDEIQPYTQEIAKYMTYGPDYAVAELEALYKKYLMMGVSYVNTQLGNVNSIINNCVLKIIHKY